VRGVAVLSGNRNYEGRAHSLVRSTFLASPPLVIAYALAGTITRDLTAEPVAHDEAGCPVYLHELWPEAKELARAIEAALDPALFIESERTVFEGTAEWHAIEAPSGGDFPWDPSSAFIRPSPLFERVSPAPEALADIRGARILAVYGDMVTTEHISPMGPIPHASPAGRYLESIGVAPDDFVSYAARRMNHDVMVRGTFASPHLRNELARGSMGGMTRYAPGGECMTIFEAAQRYRVDGVPLVIIAGKAFGTGSSRDWSAKGPHALGVRATIAESYERIYRANLTAAGVLPLEFVDGATRATLGLDGTEAIDITGLAAGMEPSMRVEAAVTRADGTCRRIALRVRLDTPQEVEHYRHGGLLRALLRHRVRASGRA
jgi:aconitate hydratase